MRGVMNPQAAAPAMTLSPVKVNALVQFLVCFGVIASTITITRSVVQSNVSKINTDLAHLQSPSALQLESDSSLGHTTFQGYIVSNKEQRYNHSKAVLENLGIAPHQYIPLSYKSDAIRKAMEEFQKGKRKNLVTDRFKKVFSNRMAFTDLFQEFVDDEHAELDSWRFFFEDDIALHPSLTKSLAQKVLKRGLEVAAEDGIIYLGICGPRNCKRKVMLTSPVEAKRCAGACTHAFGMTKWKAKKFLEYLGELKVTSMYFDQFMRTFGVKVHAIWVAGSNLKSPQAKNHYGLVFQDRVTYPSIIDGREPQQ